MGGGGGGTDHHEIRTQVTSTEVRPLQGAGGRVESPRKLEVREGLGDSGQEGGTGGRVPCGSWGNSRDRGSLEPRGQWLMRQVLWAAGPGAPCGGLAAGRGEQRQQGDKEGCRERLLP